MDICGFTLGDSGSSPSKLILEMGINGLGAGPVRLNRLSMNLAGEPRNAFQPSKDFERVIALSSDFASPDNHPDSFERIQLIERAMTAQPFAVDFKRVD